MYSIQDLRNWYSDRYAHSRHRYEMQIGKTKLLFFLQRCSPQVAEKILRPGI
ncbi:hypothetical protein [Nostoc sp. UHCC 0870]|uniref:hypothetical protein n=1 Tax=Nostoc sp. UHCC 0870 TaxID=2914041 RepID=UPI001EDD2D93|nr:hypothetical protein [Nostoc sp. UHCC 0870]UKO96592.1 hypothetical protein L6494_18475 [Nostoc sp. UHCC 0870]